MGSIMHRCSNVTNGYNSCTKISPDAAKGGGGVAQLGIYQNCKLGEYPLVRLFAGEVQTNWDSV